MLRVCSTARLHSALFFLKSLLFLSYHALSFLDFRPVRPLLFSFKSPIIHSLMTVPLYALFKDVYMLSALPA